MNTNTTKLFDANNNLIDTFEIEVENVLKSIYGENYYDIDEDFIKEEIEPQKAEKNNEISKKHIRITDFIPLLFFILIFVIIVLAGYYFLSNFDFTSILK